MSLWPQRKLTLAVFALGTWLCIGPCCASAETGLWEKWSAALRGQAPHEQAMGLYAGTAYDWSDMQFLLASWQSLYDYETLWPHEAPDALGIRFEGNLGAANGTEFSGARLMASGNVLVVYDLSPLGTPNFVPYVEAGVGLIYTDFQREGQGLRWNFNPVAGVGVRMGSTFLTLRAHHLSNSELDDENRGINSVVLGFGVYL
jgi:lipid A 3-O-deacylase